MLLLLALLPLLACAGRAVAPATVPTELPVEWRRLEGEAVARVDGTDISVAQWSGMLCQLAPAAGDYAAEQRWTILEHLVVQRLLCDEAVARGVVTGPPPRNLISCAQAAHKLLRVEYGTWNRMQTPPSAAPLARTLWHRHEVEVDPEKMSSTRVVPCGPVSSGG